MGASARRAGTMVPLLLVAAGAIALAVIVVLLWRDEDQPTVVVVEDGPPAPPMTSASPMKGAPSTVSTAVDPITGEGAWASFRGSRDLRGVAAVTLGDALVHRWETRLDGAVAGCAVVADGTVYAATAAGTLHLLDLADGSVVSVVEIGAPIACAPTVLAEEVLVATTGGSVHCLSRRDLAHRWHFTCGEQITGSPNLATVDDATLVVFGSHDRRCYALDLADGSRIWQFAAQHYLNGGVAVAEEVVAFAGCDAHLRLLAAADGEEHLAVDLGSYVAAAPAVDWPRAWVGTYAGRFACVDLEAGAVRWWYEGPGDPFFAPPAVDDEVVVFGGRDFAIRCLDRADGSERWQFLTDGPVDAGAVLCGDRVLCGSGDGRIYLLERENGSRLWSYEIGAEITATPAVIRGAVVVASHDGSVHAFVPATEGL